MRNTTTRARWDWLWGNATSHTHKTSSSQLTHHVLLALARHPSAELYELYEWKIVATANRTFEIVFMLSSVKTLNYCCLLLSTFFSYHNSPLLSHATERRERVEKFARPTEAAPQLTLSWLFYKLFSSSSSSCHCSVYANDFWVVRGSIQLVYKTVCC